MGGEDLFAAARDARHEHVFGLDHLQSIEETAAPMNRQPLEESFERHRRLYQLWLAI